jgi:hypothetical protein
MDPKRNGQPFLHNAINFDMVRLFLGSRDANRENPIWYIIGILVILVLFLVASILT